MDQKAARNTFRPFVDRKLPSSMADQLHGQIRDAIHEGRLAFGARLPSWNDLSAQLGISRGTVRSAYARLGLEGLIEADKSQGTRVVWNDSPPRSASVGSDGVPMPDLFDGCGRLPHPFQLGSPANDAFPAKLWSRLLVRSARRFAARPAAYADPRGEPELREAIAALLSLSRGIRCTPSQVMVTSGYRGALNLVCTLLDRSRRAVWVEDPGYVLARRALGHAGFDPVPIAVDGEGLDVERGLRASPDAAAAIVTPSQQFPTGTTLSPGRRRSLLDWARDAGAWIVEDDYLGELQLGGRAPNALAASDPDGRVLHIGTFSKTVCPALGVGFLVVPTAILPQVADRVAALFPAVGPVEQLAVTELLTGGHYLRHLRHMKRLYAERQDALLRSLKTALPSLAIHADGALMIRIDLPPGIDDTALATTAASRGLSPAPLSASCGGTVRPGLLLSVTNAVPSRVGQDCRRLAGIIKDAME